MFWNIVFILYLVAIVFLVKVKAVLPAVLLLILFPAVWKMRKSGKLEGELPKVQINDEDVKQAIAVLEIEGEVTEEKVKEAYHRLIKKVHPDQGGSKYLAEQINQAKATLMDFLDEQQGEE